MAWGWSERDVPDLSGRVAVVTGANRGLGREVTRYLAGGGARVIMGCRDESSGEAAAAAIGAEYPAAILEVRPLDLASLASVEKFAGWHPCCWRPEAPGSCRCRASWPASGP